MRHLGEQQLQTQKACGAHGAATMPDSADGAAVGSGSPMTTSPPRRSADRDGQTRARSELAARFDHGPEAAVKGGGGGSTLTRGARLVSATSSPGRGRAARHHHRQ